MIVVPSALVVGVIIAVVVMVTVCVAGTMRHIKRTQIAYGRVMGTWTNFGVPDVYRRDIGYFEFEVWPDGSVHPAHSDPGLDITIVEDSQGCLTGWGAGIGFRPHGNEIQEIKVLGGLLIQKAMA